jgi:hypothetical protein
MRSAEQIIPQYSYYCHVIELLLTGFGLEIGFIDHFNKRLVNTVNCSAIADLHALQFITAQANSFQPAMSSPVVPWERLLRFFSFRAHFLARWLSTSPTKSFFHRLPYN